MSNRLRTGSELQKLLDEVSNRVMKKILTADQKDVGISV